MSGQTLNDRLTAARHTLAGQGLARIVCKATTEEVIGPKKKHLDYLLHCTNEPNVSIPQLANLLIERTQHSSWVVVFKSLITVHHLMCYGNERFTQYLASSNCTFQLGTFLDKCGVQGYDMSTFIRRYAKYLNEKAVSYRTVAFDFCKCKRGKEDGILRTMNTDKLLKTLPMLQSQLDALLEFDCGSNDLTNGVVNSCFMLLFRDLIRLFACYNDGIINLLEKYFDMNKKHCREALDLYKKFLIRMDRVAEFLKVAENVGIDKGDIPDLTKAPSSLLDALEQHLASLEGRKGSSSAAPSTTRVTNVRNAVTALTLTSNAFGSAGESTSSPQEINGVKVDETVRKAVEEEAEVMSQLKFENDSPLLWEQPAWEDSERRMKEITGGEMTSPPSGLTKTNPFLSSPSEPVTTGTPTNNQGIIDLFSTPPTSGGGTEEGNTTNASADLLCLSSNPFADSLFGGQTQQQQSQQSQEQITFATFETNGFATSSTTTNAFASEASFAAAFGETTSPANQGVTAASVPTGASGAFDAFGDVLQPQSTTGGKAGGQDKSSSSSLLKGGDLDSTLASLASNLDINGPKQALKKNAAHQWGSPKPAAKTGNVGWTGAPASAAGVAPGVATGNMAWTSSPQHGFQGMGPPAGQWGSGAVIGGPFSQQPAGPGMLPQQQFMMGGVRPLATAVPGVPAAMNVGLVGTQSVQQPMFAGISPQVPLVSSTGSALPSQTSVNDPFGAL